MTRWQAMACIAFLLAPLSACSDGDPCLEKLDAEVKERCRALSDTECHALRRQQLEKIKVWNALTDEEKERAVGSCRP